MDDMDEDSDSDDEDEMDDEMKMRMKEEKKKRKQLKKLKSLLEDGVITRDEFEAGSASADRLTRPSCPWKRRRRSFARSRKR